MINLKPNEKTEIIFDYNVKIYIENNDIEVSSDGISWIDYSDTEVLYLKRNEKIFMRSNIDSKTINLKTLKETSYLFSDISDIEKSPNIVKDIYVEENKLVKTYGDDSKVEIDLNTKEISDVPDLDNIDIFEGDTKKVKVKNFKPDTLYSTTSKYIKQDEDYILITAPVIDTPVYTFTAPIIAIEPNKEPSPPKYIRVTVTSINKEDTSTVSKDFISGKIITKNNALEHISEIDGVNITELKTEKNNSFLVLNTLDSTPKKSNYLNSKILVSTKPYRVVNVDNNLIYINGYIDISINDKIMSIDKNGDISDYKVLSIEKSKNNNISNNTVLLNTGIKHDLILNADGSIFRGINYPYSYQEPIAYDKYAIVKENGGSGFIIYDEEKQVDFIYTRRMFNNKQISILADGGKYVYFGFNISSDLNLYRILKSKLINNTVTIDDFEVLNIDYSSIDYNTNILYGNTAYIDMIYFNDSIYITNQRYKGLFRIDINLKIIDKIGDFGYDQKWIHKFIAVSNELYVIGSYGHRKIFKINMKPYPSIEYYMSTDFNISYLSKGYLVIDDLVYMFANKKILDIKNKEFKNYKFNYSTPMNVNSSPVLIDNKLFYLNGYEIAVIELSYDWITLYNSSKLTLDRSISESEYIVQDPMLTYEVKNGIKILNTNVINKTFNSDLGLLSYDYATYPDINDLNNRVYRLTPNILIGMNNITIDKIILFTYNLK